ALHRHSRRDRPPGSDWLLDNEFLVREATREVREDLPPAFWRRLPPVADGPRSRPRVELLARAGIDAHDGPVEVGRLVPFVARYQTVLPLTLGELWALPAFLRLLVLEDLAAAAERLLSGPPTDTAEDPTRDARPIADRILSLRALRIQDWKPFVERLSRVEATLRRDPANAYARMDFATRDRYRRRVERLARALGTDESRVAETAVRLAALATPGVERHVGHSLLGAGRPAHERALGFVPPPATRLVRRLARHAVAIHTGAIVLLGAILLGLLGRVAHPDPPGTLALLLLLAVVPACGLALALVHWLATLLVPPRVLCKLDFEKRLPDEERTVLAIPALVGDFEEIDELLRQMETAWLTDPSPAFTLVLLSDLADAPQAVRPGDEALVERLVEGVRALNRRYDDAGRRPFRLLHRKRRWNPQEGVWMGWERKRGKLESFLALCRGDAGEDFVVREGGIADLKETRYLITLDADTFLPRGAARRLVGAMAHPLNRPRFDEDGRVLGGYTVMQPRVESKPLGGRRTIFSRIYAGDAVLDLYTHAVSEVYQDLFGEGIYAGKGILDVDGFRRSLEDRVPENALLSHDLFEGIHGRAALIDDVVVLEGFPARYRTWQKRL
ncbi:MAG: cellobiose phosphorylase, partial [Planctomycetota bacterium]